MTKRLHSQVLGKGRPLLILHGFLGMSDNWKTLGSKYAEANFEVHLIDQRNHGKSFWSPDFDYGVLAKDLKEYMNDHRLKKAAILGHSMGGKTAMQFACSFSEKTEKLIVADIAPKYYPPHHQEIIDGLNTLDFDVIKSRGDADDLLKESISNRGVRQFLLKNLYWVQKGRLGLRFNLNILSEKMNEIGENISATDQYTGPTLFLRGDRSEYIVEGDLAEIRKHFPRAILETVSNAGHWLHAENPEQFFAKSLSFLNS